MTIIGDIMSDSRRKDSGGVEWGMLAVFLGAMAALGFWAGSRRGRARSPGHPEDRTESWISRGIVGTARGELAKRFGPPVVASGGDYWQADTWYYPVDRGNQTGIAIRFQEHVAKEVEFIRGPEGE